MLDGDKVKVTVMYRGREMVHRQLGRVQLDRVVEMLGNLATVENPPRMEGRFLSMILVPNREAVAEMQREERQAEKARKKERSQVGGGPAELPAGEDEIKDVDWENLDLDKIEV